MLAVKRKRDYNPTLEEALQFTNGTRVNIVGIVAYAGPGGRSKGTDYLVTLRVIDHSCINHGIIANIFTRRAEDLPKVRSFGDIISLHGVVIRYHSGRPNIVHYTDSSSYALFNVQDAASFNYYQAGPKYRTIDCDNQFIAQLRTWFSVLPDEADIDEEAVPLRRINDDLNCNIVCKVLHLFQTPESKCILFVWDGTDYPSGTFDNNLDLEGPTTCPVDFGGLPISREILCRFPRMGSVLRVFTNKPFEEFVILLGNKPWVKLYDTTCRFRSGFWEVVLQPSGRVDILSDQNWVVNRRVRAHAHRFESRLGFPTPSSLTVSDCADPTKYLREFLFHSEAADHGVFIVRVVSMCPCRVEDLCLPNGSYIIRLTLEDQTARIHAFIMGKERDTFFGHHTSSDVLTSNLNKLLGIVDINDQVRADGRRDPPWILCHLRSFYFNEDDMWGSRKYQICFTRLVGN